MLLTPVVWFDCLVVKNLAWSYIFKIFCPCLLTSVTACFGWRLSAHCSLRDTCTEERVEEEQGNSLSFITGPWYAERGILSFMPQKQPLCQEEETEAQTGDTTWPLAHRCRGARQWFSCTLVWPSRLSLDFMALWSVKWHPGLFVP